MGIKKMFFDANIFNDIFDDKRATQQSSKEALRYAIENEIAEIISFAKDELSLAIALMRNDSDYTDMEDTIQYILAKKIACDLIVTNDKRFMAKEIDCVKSENFMELME